MNEATKEEESASLDSIDSSQLSTSTIGRSNNNAQELEDLKRELREARSENLELKRAIPKLKDANGENCTEWAIRITNELEVKKEKYAESQNKLAKLTHQYREFKENMESVARKNERIIEEFRGKAESLEEENLKLRDCGIEINLEEGRNCHPPLPPHFPSYGPHFPQNKGNIGQSAKSKSSCIRDHFISATMGLAILTLFFVIFVHVYILIRQF